MTEPKSVVDDPFLGVDRVARIFDVSPYTVRQWIKDKEMEATKINNKWKVRESEVNRFAQKEYGNAPANTE